MQIRSRLPCILLAALTACGSQEPPNDPGPKPSADAEHEIQGKVLQLFAEKTDPEGTATDFRFSEPERDKVARWHFDPEIPGKAYEFGYVHGWRVDVWYTPEYVGYPEQPERHDMAFFGEGQLRGIFAEGLGNAPLELDKWHARWVDAAWQPLARKPMTASQR